MSKQKQTSRSSPDDHDQSQLRMQLLQISFDQMADSACWIDKNGLIINVNNTACRKTGYTFDELIGMSITRVMPDFPATDWPRFWNSIKGKQSITFEGYLRHQAGHELPIEISANLIQLEDQEIVCAFGRDLGERQRHKQELIRLATHDPLTGLPNRNLLDDRIQQTIRHAKRNHRSMALMHLDLDQFKLINDNFGHNISNALLVGVSQRLQSALRETDTIAREGGDEFMIIIDELQGTANCNRVAESILAALNEPFLIGDQELHITVSIGLALYPRDGEDSDTLNKHADIAMYRAKELGGNTFHYFNKEMEASLSEKMSLRHGLHRALEQQEFVLHYQPVIDMISGRMVYAEALIRWQRPDEGLIPPIKFIPAAEESGIIIPIGTWVLNEACRQNQAWRESGLDIIPIAVNLSAMQLRQNNIVATVRDAMENNTLEPQYLSLELTESMIMDDPERVIDILKQLQQIGMRLAIDDFGTGYSSLSYLKRFPIDIIKIDRSFIRDLVTDGDDAIITATIISMAHSLGYRVTAEGIEDEAQMEFLAHYRCDHAQGYHFSRPIPADEFAQLLKIAKPLPL